MAIKTIGLSIELLSHPGETLQEVLQSNGMTQKELAARIGVADKTISQIINGKESITPQTAQKLSNVFNLSASFWNNLQKIYDEELAFIKERETITQEEIEEIKKLEYNKLVDYHYLEPAKSNKDKVINVRKFVKISNLMNADMVLKVACFRKSQASITNPLALLVWMKICEKETQNVILKKLDLNLLESYLPEIKQLMFLNINSAINKLKEIFNECGVNFVVVHNIKGAPVQGYIQNQDNGVRMCLTIRNKYADIFWFTLFHEIGHLFDSNAKDYLNNGFIDYESQNNEIEAKADKFATNILIEEKQYKKFIANGVFSASSIIDAAKQFNVMTGILVGRLQHDGYVAYSQFNDLRQKYDWAK